MIKHILVSLLLVLFITPASSIVAQDDCEGHDHDAEEHGTLETTEHDDDDHEIHADDGDGHDEDEIIVSLSPEAQKMAGITLAKVSSGHILKTSELPGEVGFNEDRLVHISPRFAGIALEAKCRVGNYVPVMWLR